LIKIEPACASSHYLLGHALGALGEQIRALSELYKAESLGYSGSDLHSALGYAQHMKGDIEKAIESYKRAIEIDPNDTITWFNYGKALIAQRSYVAARKALETAVEIDPEDDQAWVALGEVYEDLDELDLALQAYERALDLELSSPEARCLAAHVCLMLGRLEEAEWEYTHVVGAHPDDGDAWAGLGEVLIAQERYHEALSACRKALEVEPTSVYGLSGYINACERTGAFDEARRAVADAMEKDPMSSDLWYLMAGVEAAAEMPEQALPAYMRSVKLDPSDAAAHAGIGWALVQLDRDYAVAEMHLIEAVRLAPDWFYPCLQLGELFLQRNDRYSAAEWFARAYEIAPDEPEVREAFLDPELRELIDSQSG
jgi:tetratricopeptide (TPR) repeat protein